MPVWLKSRFRRKFGAGYQSSIPACMYLRISPVSILSPPPVFTPVRPTPNDVFIHADKCA